jgi:hypothetical protein
VAFGAWLKEYHKENQDRLRKKPRDHVVTIDGHGVEVRTIPDYFTDEFVDCLKAWSTTRRWSVFPFDGGWAEQPCRLMDVMNEFERMFAEWESNQ